MSVGLDSVDDWGIGEVRRRAGVRREMGKRKERR